VPLALLAAPAAAQDRPIAPGDLRSGYQFQSRATQQMQDDELANPGMLWVAEGERLWRRSEVAGSCAGCHGEDARAMRGVAARYPAYDARSARVINLEQRILQCRERQGAPPLAYESRELLALTAFVAQQSRGAPIDVSIDGPARPFFAAGRAFYEARQGQLHLSCANCHDDNWGRQLRGDRLSQGHPNGYPTYRLEWQTLGSLQRRLRFCSAGVRAEVLDYGAQDYVNLELFLAWRAQGLAIETPAVRR
jgi:sulfur-oxidizing protein SoxA